MFNFKKDFRNNEEKKAYIDRLNKLQGALLSGLIAEDTSNIAYCQVRLHKAFLEGKPMPMDVAERLVCTPDNEIAEIDQRLQELIGKEE